MSNPRHAFRIDDVVAYFEWEKRQQARALAALTPEQQAITWGDHWIRFWREPGWSGQAPGIVIYGSVQPLEVLREHEEPETVERLIELHPRFVFSNCFSVVEPGGEYGDVNRWEIWPISKEHFDLAARCGWDDGADVGLTRQSFSAIIELQARRIPFEDEPLPPGVTPL